MVIYTKEIGFLIYDENWSRYIAHEFSNIVKEIKEKKIEGKGNKRKRRNAI